MINNPVTHNAFMRQKRREYEHLMRVAVSYRHTVRLYAKHGHDYVNQQLAVIQAKVHLGRAKRLRQTYGL